MKDPTEMTEQELRVAVAEECGWTNLRQQMPPSARGPAPELPHPFSGMLGKPPAHYGYVASGLWVPDYPTDLNACAAFEATLNERQQSNYYMEIYDMVEVESDEYGWIAASDGFKITHASARQRCIAFLRVVAQRQPEAAIALNPTDVKDA